MNRKYPRAQYHRDYFTAVPASVSLALAFLPDHVTDRDFDRHAKKVIRRVIAIEGPDALLPGDGADLWQHYDERIWPLIREVLAEN